MNLALCTGNIHTYKMQHKLQLKLHRGLEEISIRSLTILSQGLTTIVRQRKN